MYQLNSNEPVTLIWFNTSIDGIMCEYNLFIDLNELVFFNLCFLLNSISYCDVMHTGNAKLIHFFLLYFHFQVYFVIIHGIHIYVGHRHGQMKSLNSHVHHSMDSMLPVSMTASKWFDRTRNYHNERWSERK